MEAKEESNKNKEDGLAGFESLCEDSYDRIKSEIVAAICEGVEKGLKDGITDGISCGLKDCLGIGFLNVKDAGTKTLEEIMEEVAAGMIAKEVKDCVKNDTCPALKRCAKKSCDKIVEEIKREQENVAKADIYLIRAMHMERICKEKSKEIKQDIEGKLPQDFISAALFDGMLEAISECMVEAVGNCTEKIGKLAQEDKPIKVPEE
jgi:hypothetical protein